MRKRFGMSVFAVLLLSGCASPLAWNMGAAHSGASRGSAVPGETGVPSTVPVAKALGDSTRDLIGVFEAGVPGSWSNISKFSLATGVMPKAVLYYSTWKETFKEKFARTAHSHSAYVVVQLQPNKVTMASIASGDSDRYLRSYADAVRNFGYPVVISFAHEMNGDWYSWGAGHTSPSDYVAAWRHVVHVFRHEGASNVTWLWTVNSTNTPGDLLPWWPGSSYVDWVGIDGYYYRSTDTFDSVFGHTIEQLREFTKAPVFITETAVGVTPNRETQIKDLFANVKGQDMVGLVWFDKPQNSGIYHQDWHLEDDSSALAEFKTAAERYLAQ